MIFINLIPHGNFAGVSPEGQMIALIVTILAFGVGYGIYLTFGPGGKDIKDPIAEHARMHELGIAHGHKGNKVRVRHGNLDALD